MASGRGAAPPRRSAVSDATKRLGQDYLRLKADPVPYAIAEPLPDNWFVWHYVLRGPERTPYEGGFYHGKLAFPREFPFKPPAIYMITPNGRFKTNTRLCLSISDFHSDTWNPTWTVSTILTGLLSFMLERTPTFGSLETADRVKRQLAARSLRGNLENATFRELFPDTVREIEEMLRRRDETAREEENAPRANDPDSLPESVSRERTAFHYVVSNLCVIIAFVIIGYVIKHVLDNLDVE